MGLCTGVLLRGGLGLSEKKSSATKVVDSHRINIVPRRETGPGGGER